MERVTLASSRCDINSNNENLFSNSTRSNVLKRKAESMPLTHSRVSNPSLLDFVYKSQYIPTFRQKNAQKLAPILANRITHYLVQSLEYSTEDLDIDKLLIKAKLERTEEKRTKIASILQAVEPLLREANSNEIEKSEILKEVVQYCNSYKQNTDALNTYLQICISIRTLKEKINELALSTINAQDKDLLAKRIEIIAKDLETGKTINPSLFQNLDAILEYLKKLLYGDQDSQTIDNSVDAMASLWNSDIMLKVLEESNRLTSCRKENAFYFLAYDLIESNLHIRLLRQQNLLQEAEVLERDAKAASETLSQMHEHSEDEATFAQDDFMKDIQSSIIAFIEMDQNGETDLENEYARILQILNHISTFHMPPLKRLSIGKYLIDRAIIPMKYFLYKHNPNISHNLLIKTIVSLFYRSSPDLYACRLGISTVSFQTYIKTKVEAFEESRLSLEHKIEEHLEASKSET